eukprot:scaffold45011_cov25-Tisochrysis_lutea.AAC.1
MKCATVSVPYFNSVCMCACCCSLLQQVDPQAASFYKQAAVAAAALGCCCDVYAVSSCAVSQSVLMLSSGVCVCACVFTRTSVCLLYLADITWAYALTHSDACISHSACLSFLLLSGEAGARMHSDVDMPVVREVHDSNLLASSAVESAS